MQVTSLADLAKHHIELWIIKGDYQPGQKLKEEEIAARLGISRPPIREAFKTLEAEGLVVRRPRRGVFVTEMTARDLWEAYTLKAVLYEMATELAIDVITGGQIRRLEGFVEEMARCMRRRPVDILRYQAHHQGFHDLIVAACGNRRLKKIAASLHNQVCRYSYRSLQDTGHLASSLDYHRRILAAVKAGDKAAARRLTRAHVMEALEVCRRQIDNEEANPQGGEKRVMLS